MRQSYSGYGVRKDGSTELSYVFCEVSNAYGPYQSRVFGSFVYMHEVDRLQ